MTVTLLDRLHDALDSWATLASKFAQTEQVYQYDSILVGHRLHPYARWEVALFVREPHGNTSGVKSLDGGIGESRIMYLVPK